MQLLLSLATLFVLNPLELSETHLTTVLFLKTKSFVGMTTISLPFCHQGSHLPCAYVPTHIHILYSQLKQNRIMDLSRGYQFNLALVLHNPFMAYRVHIFLSIFHLFQKIGLDSASTVCGVAIQRLSPC